MSTRYARMLALSACVGLATSCAYRPPRFADAPPAVRARDDLPVPVPRHTTLDQREEIAEVYMRRPLFDALDLSRFPEAGDVNARDEVVESSWFSQDASRLWDLRGYEQIGVPVPPLALDGPVEPGKDVLPVRDVRGLPYVLRKDRADRPEMRTAAEAIASRLAWSFGYSTPEVHVIELTSRDFREPGKARTWLGDRDRVRLSAALWPPGIDLGPTPSAMMRDDDPNDVLPHRDRRTLRVLAVIGAWLQMPKVGPHVTRDVYIGMPGCGHVRHYLTGFDGALGTTKVGVPRPAGAPRPDTGPDPLQNFYTLGLSPDPAPGKAQLEFPALGAITQEVDPKRWHADLPYEPADRMLPEDAYWAARRLMRMSASVLAGAVAAGRLSDPNAAQTLLEILEARRRKVAEYWIGRVTPLQLIGEEKQGLVLRDDASAFGFEGVAEYRIQYLDENGNRLVSDHRAKPGSSCFWLGVPRRDYIVMRIWRDGRERPAELHLANGRVVGLRH